MSKRNLDLCQMGILLPAAATAAEQTAAEELRDHIEKMSGVTLAVETEKETQAEYKAIYIGNTRFAADNQVTFPNNRPGEGWAIKAVDGNLVLCGGKVRGVLYAVYHLLEDVLGFHWWTFWDEHVPSASEALVSCDYESSGVPAMEYRDIFTCVRDPNTKFFVRNRLNGFSIQTSGGLGGKEGFGEPAHIHTFDRYFPENYTCKSPHYDPEWADLLNPNKENYFQTHPEWFALSGRNKRVPRYLCMTNESLQKAFEERLLKTIAFSYEKADRAGVVRPRYFDISPVDEFGECACPKCRASIRKHGSSGHQLLFLNKLAEAVEKVYPEAVIDTVAYWHYVEPPKSDIKPRKNLQIRFADNYMDILHDIYHKNNEPFLRRVTAWSKLCAKDRLYIWDYGVTYGPNGVFPWMYKLEKNFKLFKEVGVNGYFLEMEHCINTDFWDMKVWLCAKLMENPDLDLRTLMDTFIDGYYGPAGEYIRRYLDDMHQAAEKNSGMYRFGASIIRGDGLTVEDIIRANHEFDGAFDAAAGDDVLLRRLRDARRGLDRVFIENYDRYAAEATQKNLTLPVEKAVIGRRLAEGFAQQVALRGQWDFMGEQGLKQYEMYLPGYVATEKPAATVSEHKRVSTLNGCANAWTGPAPQIVEESELSSYGKDDLYVFLAEMDFSATSFGVEEDPDSPYGAAHVCDIGELRRRGHITEEAVAERWGLENDDITKILPIGVYTGKLDEEAVPISNIWGTLRVRDIVADGKYHLYKFSDVSLPQWHTGSVFHVFRNWGLVIPTLPRELVDLQGKKLDLYLSMKVSGNVTCADLRDLPVYSIDRFIVADKTAK